MKSLIMAGLGIVLMAATCDPSPVNRTSVGMTRTFDVLTETGLGDATSRVNSFVLGNELPRVARTEASWSAVRVMPRAGRESPPCNDGTPVQLLRDGGPDRIFASVVVIGDTGGDDISGDRNCQCDTHIPALQLRPFTVQGDPPLGEVGHANFTLGRDQLCPNRLDDIASVTSDFDGDVTASISTRLYIQDGRLLLDVTYSVTRP